jgi:hypothetical protein
LQTANINTSSNVTLAVATLLQELGLVPLNHGPIVFAFAVYLNMQPSQLWVLSQQAQAVEPVQQKQVLGGL